MLLLLQEGQVLSSLSHLISKKWKSASNGNFQSNVQFKIQSTSTLLAFIISIYYFSLFLPRVSKKHAIAITFCNNLHSRMMKLKQKQKTKSRRRNDNNSLSLERYQVCNLFLERSKDDWNNLYEQANAIHVEIKRERDPCTQSRRSWYTSDIVNCFCCFSFFSFCSDHAIVFPFLFSKRLSESIENFYNKNLIKTRFYFRLYNEWH